VVGLVGKCPLPVADLWEVLIFHPARALILRLVTAAAPPPEHLEHVIIHVHESFFSHAIAEVIRPATYLRVEYINNVRLRGLLVLSFSRSATPSISTTFPFSRRSPNCQPGTGELEITRTDAQFGKHDATRACA
jgi:hypothetical protein